MMCLGWMESMSLFRLIFGEFLKSTYCGCNLGILKIPKLSTTNKVLLLIVYKFLMRSSSVLEMKFFTV